MGFSLDWLTLREPVDHVSRDAGLLAQAVACAGQGAVVVDLGSGTGSTARAFGDAACATCQWRFVDSDRALLDIAQARHPGAERVVFDLRNIDQLPLEGVGLVTASALLDLMSLEWVTVLARRLQGAGIPFYGALNFNGVMRWSPRHYADAGVTRAFNVHQRTDKGIGPALGPTASEAATKVFKQHGFDVHLADSPWKLGAAEARIHEELLAGIGHAAAEVGFAQARDWVADRRAAVAQTAAYIGHTDILALPPKVGE